MPEWENVIAANGDGSGTAVRRLKVPGGWLYQVAMALRTVEPAKENHTYGWGAPVFVAEKSDGA